LRHRRSMLNDNRWLTQSYLGAIDANIRSTHLAASCSFEVPGGVVPVAVFTDLPAKIRELLAG
jgi:hypothetical protein